jgi:hypothetical protein
MSAVSFCSCIIAPIIIPEESCKKNWNNKKKTLTNHMVALLGLSEGVDVSKFINSV